MATVAVAASPPRARVTFDTLPFDVKLLIIAALEELEPTGYNAAISQALTVSALYRTTRRWRDAARETVWKAVCIGDSIRKITPHVLLDNRVHIHHVTVYATNSTDRDLLKLLPNLHSAELVTTPSGDVCSVIPHILNYRGNLTALSIDLSFASADDVQTVSAVLPLLREIVDLRLENPALRTDNSVETLFLAAAKLPKLRLLGYQDGEMASTTWRAPFSFPSLRRLALSVCFGAHTSPSTLPPAVRSILSAASASLERLRIDSAASFSPGLIDLPCLWELESDLPDIKQISLF